LSYSLLSTAKKSPTIKVVLVEEGKKKKLIQ